jgi:hypothetical protein
MPGPFIHHLGLWKLARLRAKRCAASGLCKPKARQSVQTEAASPLWATKAQPLVTLDDYRKHHENTSFRALNF